MNNKTGEYTASCYLPETGETLHYRVPYIETFSNIDEYWMKRKGLVFFPFDRNGSAYFFPEDKAQEKANEFSFTINEPLSRMEYETTVLMALESMREGSLDKVVLARNEIIRGRFNPEDTFENALIKHPDSYCFMVNFGEEQWVGASPELLLHFENDTVQTVALAGTKTLEEAFSSKEIEEQEMVEQFVEEKLEVLGLSAVKKSERTEARFDRIKHLRTDYKAKANAELALKLLKHLQPTSAVCGLPRDKSFAFINEFETLNRSFYSGLTGVLRENSATFFVNLRCMRFSENQVELFAGAGITASSDPAEEWEETERKIRAIRALIGD